MGSQAIDGCAHPPGASGVGAQATDQSVHQLGALSMCAWAAGLLIRVHANRASGVCWGCLSGVHSPGAERVGVQEARAAVENSLNSH